MYEEPHILTENERLHDKITIDRFIELIKSKKLIVYRFIESENSFGEYLFFDGYLKDKKEIYDLSGYGLGFNWLREKIDKIDSFSLSCYSFKAHNDVYRENSKKALKLKEIQKIIKDRKKLVSQSYIKTSIKSDTQKEFKNNIIDFLESMTDEDSVKTELEDLGLY